MGCHFLLQVIFEAQGSNPRTLVSPALAGVFFATVSPGKLFDKSGGSQIPATLEWGNGGEAGSSPFNCIFPGPLKTAMPSVQGRVWESAS